MSHVRQKVQGTAPTSRTHTWFHQREGERNKQKTKARGERSKAECQANKVPLPEMWPPSSPRGPAFKNCSQGEGRRTGAIQNHG